LGCAAAPAANDNEDDEDADVDVRDEVVSCRAKQSDFSLSFLSRRSWHKAEASVMMDKSRERANAAADDGDSKGMDVGMPNISAAY
jgi:hypothetical protein